MLSKPALARKRSKLNYFDKLLTILMLIYSSPNQTLKIEPETRMIISLIKVHKHQLYDTKNILFIMKRKNKQIKLFFTISSANIKTLLKSVFDSRYPKNNKISSNSSAIFGYSQLRLYSAVSLTFDDTADTAYMGQFITSRYRHGNHLSDVAYAKLRSL